MTASCRVSIARNKSSSCPFLLESNTGTQPTLDGARMAIKAPSSQPTISCVAKQVQLGCFAAPLTDGVPLLFLLHGVVAREASLLGTAETTPALDLPGVAGVPVLRLREIFVGDALEIVVGVEAAPLLRLRGVVAGA